MVIQDIEGYNYGTIPNTPIVGQTDTFMAFCESWETHDPNWIKAYKYRVKVLIDEEGNVYSPDDNDPALSTSMKNLFARGKNVQLRAVTPNSGALDDIRNFGMHPSLGVGALENILVTTTGSDPLDYIRTMSFGTSTNSAVEDVQQSFYGNVGNTPASWDWETSLSPNLLYPYSSIGDNLTVYGNLSKPLSPNLS